MSTGFNHVIQIDPNWPAPFCDPSWWRLTRTICIAEGMARASMRTKGRSWSAAELTLAADLLREHEDWQVVARRVGHSLAALEAQVRLEGNKAAFIGKYSSYGNTGTSSQPVPAAASAPFPDGDASHQSGGREP